MKLVLQHPIQFETGDAPVTELKFREMMVAGDVRGIKLKDLQDPAAEDLLKIAARLSGQPELLMSKLSLGDMMAVIGAVGGFIKAGLETGTTA